MSLLEYYLAWNPPWQNVSVSNDELGSSPTMNGNRTCEIFGEIDVNHLTVGEELGYGEFGSVFRGKWLSPSGDQVSWAWQWEEWENSDFLYVLVNEWLRLALFLSLFSFFSFSLYFLSSFSISFLPFLFISFLFFFHLFPLLFFSFFLLSPSKCTVPLQCYYIFRSMWP